MVEVLVVVAMTRDANVGGVVDGGDKNGIRSEAQPDEAKVVGPTCC